MGAPFHGELYGLPREAMKARIGQVLEMVDLTDRKDSKVETFSGGMKRRLEIARGCCTHRGCCS
jgi:ABC-2 type transport system ATP-binding protein